jgi:GNAT superfamily N-acetyltransferase
MEQQPANTGEAKLGVVEWRFGEFTLTDDPAKIDFEAVYCLLQATYWAGGRSRETTLEAMRHSACLGLCHGGKLIGFARIVSDRATFAWICDVVVDPAWRGRGLGKWMVERTLEHPAARTRTQALATRDAHTLYERHGFLRTEFLRRGPPTSPPAGS